MLLTCTAARKGRLSSFLREELNMSAGLMNRLKWQELLFVNGVPRHTDYPVEPGDVITVTLSEEKPEYPAEEGPLTILYEDDHLLAVDKPAGMLIHPSHSRNTGTLANLVAGYYQKRGIPAAFHPVTRLDRDTFGIVLLAKNAHAHNLLNAQHSRGALKKTYHALTYGGPDREEGTIDAPIARREKPSLLRFVDGSGKPSVTHYRVLRREGQTCLLELQPITGRTHQLRVHCAYMGFPILGDPQYGSPEALAFAPELAHQQLCAKRLEFTHPITGAPLCLESALEPTR